MLSHPGLSQWGFSLLVQFILYSALSFLFEESRKKRKNQILSLLSLLLIYSIIGWSQYGFLFIAQPEKFFFLLSGGFILFWSLEPRAIKSFVLTFIVYIIISVTGGFLISPAGKGTVGGVAVELLVFICILIWGFLLLIFFHLRGELAPHKLQALVPILFGGLFLVLENFPSLEGLYLLRWIRGMDLLLLLIGLILLMEPDEGEVRSQKKGYKAAHYSKSIEPK